MQNVKRFDNFNLGKNVKITPQGFLIIPAHTARTGLQTYLKEDGTPYVELRPEDEVFSEESMSSLRTAALTNRHPVTMVNPKNAKDIVVGHTDGVITKVEENGEHYLATHLVVTHQDAIDAIMKGRAEISNGYVCALDFTPGDYKGQRYDAIQRKIVNNHIALVDVGRAGRNVRLKLDSLDSIEENNEGTKLMKIKIGQKEFEVNDEVGAAFKEELQNSANAVTAEKAKADAAIADKTTLTAKVDSLTSDLEKAKTAAVPKMDAAQVHTAAKARIGVLKVGERLLTKEDAAKMDGMTDLEIKKLVIKADSPKIEDAKLGNEAYVDARFDHILENLENTDKTKSQVGKNLGEQRSDKKDGDGKDESTSDPETVRKANMDSAQTAEQKPIGITKETVR